MKIKSSKQKTRHILIRVTPYAPFGEEDKFIEYEFLYFNYSKSIEDKVKLFHKNWKSGIVKVQRFPVAIFEATLLKSYSIENTDNTNNPDYKYIKFDSLNHLEHEPVFDEIDEFYKLNCTFLCYKDYFVIEIERIIVGYIAPITIYRAYAYYNELTDIQF